MNDKEPRREPRSRRLEIRVTDSELAAIDAAAKRAGMTRTAYIVAAATGADVSPVVVDVEPLRQTARKWSGVASNINQLARAANSGRLAADAELRAALSDTLTAAIDAKSAVKDVLWWAQR